MIFLVSKSSQLKQLVSNPPVMQTDRFQIIYYNSPPSLSHIFAKVVNTSTFFFNQAYAYLSICIFNYF